jgi:hypothetical protein
MTLQVLALVVGAAWALLARSAGIVASKRANTARNTEERLGRADIGDMLTPSQLGNLPSFLRSQVCANRRAPVAWTTAADEGSGVEEAVQGVDLPHLRLDDLAGEVDGVLEPVRGVGGCPPARAR